MKCKECQTNDVVKNGIFCSQSCAASFNNRGVVRNGIDTGKCLICGTKLNSSARIYCSAECYGKGKSREKDQQIEQGLISNRPPLRRYVIERDGHKCSVCNEDHWMGESIPLVLDHIDGNSENNFPNNLRMVCGNCDMQLPTYKSRNRGNGRHSRRKRYEENKSF